MRLHLLNGPLHERKWRAGNLFGGALAASRLGLGQTEKAHLFQIGHKDKAAREDGEGLKRKKGIQGIPARDAVGDPAAVMASQRNGAKPERKHPQPPRPAPIGYCVQEGGHHIDVQKGIAEQQATEGKAG